MKERFTLILAFFCLVGYGQSPYTLPQVTPKSPNVAGFDKYGNIPVSLSNGVANVSIPLTKISIGGVDIPITLNYHNTGLKVEEFASMVGMGWDLQVGGSISFSQRGINDFDLTHQGLQYSYPQLRNYLNGSLTTQQKFTFLEDIIGG